MQTTGIKPLRWRALAALAVVTPAIWPFAAQSACLEVAADVNADGSANISDVQCQILAVLYGLSGSDVPPTCVGPGFNQRTDQNCDFSLDVADIQFAIGAALEIDIAKDFDSNLNGCVDACEAVFVDCTTAPDLTPCEDGNACTFGDVCGLGECLGGSAEPCDDGNPCTAADCSGDEGCTVQYELSCDDSDPCTVDACDPESGHCVHTYAPASGGCKEATACDQHIDCRMELPELGAQCHYSTSQCGAAMAAAQACAGTEKTCYAQANSIPLDWYCQKYEYGSGDGCDCGCGAPDPDCDGTTVVAFNCPAGSACDPDGHCAADPQLPQGDCLALQDCAPTLESAELCDAGLAACTPQDLADIDDCNALLTACLSN